MSKIVSIRRVKNDGLQVEIMDQVVHPGRVNVLAELNKGDARFQTGNPRRAWFPVTMLSLIDLGISSEKLEAISKLSYNEKLELEIESPKVNGEELRIQVLEFTKPGAYETANTMKAAKKIEITEKVAANRGLNTKFELSKYIGQQGYFLDKDGNHIFSRANVTLASQVKSVFIEGELVPENELSSFGATLAEPMKVATFTEAEG